MIKITYNDGSHEYICKAHADRYGATELVALIGATIEEVPSTSDCYFCEQEGGQESRVFVAITSVQCSGYPIRHSVTTHNTIRKAKETISSRLKLDIDRITWESGDSIIYCHGPDENFMKNAEIHITTLSK